MGCRQWINLEQRGFEGKLAFSSWAGPSHSTLGYDNPVDFERQLTL